MALQGGRRSACKAITGKTPGSAAPCGGNASGTVYFRKTQKNCPAEGRKEEQTI